MRNFILTAALFLTASIAFAQVKAEPGTTPTTVTDKYFEINDLDGGNKTNYTWTVKPYTGKDKNGGWYSISATVVRDNTDEFSYKVFDASGMNKEWNHEISVALKYDDEIGDYVVDMKESKNLVGYRDVYAYNTVQKENDLGELYTTTEKGDFLRRVYYFSLPVKVEVEFDDDGNRIVKYPVSELGVKMDGKLSTVNSVSPSIFYRVADQQYYLSFGAPVTDSEGKIIRNDDPQIAFGQPLPAPLATLLIALGFGAAFVLYRNRKQVKA